MFALLFLMLQAAQAQQPPNSNCSAISSMSQQSSVPEKDPCSNTTAYSELGSCGRYMSGNVTTPSAECCASAHDVWASFPACFCKVTFFSKFPDDGPARALARPTLCNITDDLCSQCPGALAPFQSDNTGGHKGKINTASVVTISVIVTLAIVGCVWLLYFCKKKAPWKPKQSPSKNYVPQFNNV
jgi:hypothetical protein